jgi:hypothetical protein
MKILVTEAQYENLINEMGRQGGAHSRKIYDKFIKWAKEFLNVRVIEKGNSHMICPPKEKYPECRSTHPHDRAIYDIMRFFATAYNVEKPVIERAFQNNTGI